MTAGEIDLGHGRLSRDSRVCRSSEPSLRVAGMSLSFVLLANRSSTLSTTSFRLHLSVI